MAKSIVLLNGSPHKDGPTSKLVNTFVSGAQTGGAKVTEFLMEDMNIHTCIGCWKGNSQQEYPCIMHDAMERIYPVVKEAEVVVLASPVYYWNLSGQLKTTVDRLVALEEGTDILTGQGRTVALLMTAAGESDQFDIPLTWYQKFHSKMKWKDLGYVTATVTGGDISPTDLESANGLGQRAATGMI